MPDLDPDDIAPRELPPPRFPQRTGLEREGLPPGYRMRADAHYVDQLTARSPDAPGQMRRAAQTSAHADRDSVNSDVMRHVADAISTIQSATGLVAADASPLVRRVAIDLIRAAAWRAAWELRAAAILDGTYRWRVQPRLLGNALQRVRDGFAADGRLKGVDVRLRVDDWNTTADVDEDALVAGLSGAVAATAVLMVGVDSPHVVVALESSDGHVAIDVSQTTVAVDADASAHVLDRQIGGRAARAVAERHGGDATLVVDAPRGSTLRLTLASTSMARPVNTSRNPQA